MNRFAAQMAEFRRRFRHRPDASESEVSTAFGDHLRRARTAERHDRAAELAHRIAQPHAIGILLSAAVDVDPVCPYWLDIRHPVITDDERIELDLAVEYLDRLGRIERSPLASNHVRLREPRA